ncbi:hypothetical protein ACKUSY_03085 [Myroides odoratus]|uniref:Uncharacterized protein n=2 Tax=Myroides odoratimimus TaxID=76832 RepID=A0AAI8C647_9FLAO|nr:MULTISPECIES: hypothetical protein [Myroides]ALU26834.1 hypothetical protein AS202_12055 [Myroides odoratimimus]ALU27497.1 hypothetical protein AS202_15695 [Myroides odoratimimus]EHO06165.1 hypothetical protein HMPREF9712_03228 [Myroides odoratimimus CCUG 10230]MDM1036298.1 hypothetical protein [Myroides odoratimimus]MDM1362618.1 hypothetical protein [Myroides marinus]
MLIIGNYIDNVRCESFKDFKTNRIRIRPLAGQNIPTDLVIESSKVFRDTNRYPLGSVFIAKRVKVCQKEIGRIYLRADKQELDFVQ